MAEETQYTAKTGMVTMSLANTNLDGTGSNIYTVISGGTNGTLIKTLTIKSQGTTSQGMIRLFINTQLIAEIEVPPIPIPSPGSGTMVATFETHLDLDLNLASGDDLKATTQNANTFNVIAFGLDWDYYAADVRTDTTEFTGGAGITAFSSANTSRTGSGTIEEVAEAGPSSGGFLGSKLNSINIKATGTTSPGMVRLFIQDDIGPTAYLYREIPVPAVVGTASTDPSFGYVINFNEEGLYVQSDYKLMVSTELAESFVCIADGVSWKYS